MTSPAQPDVQVPASQPGSAPAKPQQNFEDSLDQMVKDLRGKYTRKALRGRLDQIEQHTVTLKHLVGQLADEDEREADYEDRLLEAHDAGEFGQSGGRPHTGSFDARERLQDALSRRKGS